MSGDTAANTEPSEAVDNDENADSVEQSQDQGRSALPLLQMN